MAKSTHKNNLMELNQYGFQIYGVRYNDKKSEIFIDIAFVDKNPSKSQMANLFEYVESAEINENKYEDSYVENEPIDGEMQMGVAPADNLRTLNTKPYQYMARTSKILTFSTSKNSDGFFAVKTPDQKIFFKYIGLMHESYDYKAPVLLNDKGVNRAFGSNDVFIESAKTDREFYFEIKLLGYSEREIIISDEFLTNAIGQGLIADANPEFFIHRFGPEYILLASGKNAIPPLLIDEKTFKPVLSPTYTNVFGRFDFKESKFTEFIDDQMIAFQHDAEGTELLSMHFDKKDFVISEQLSLGDSKYVTRFSDGKKVSILVENNDAAKSFWSLHELTTVEPLPPQKLKHIRQEVKAIELHEDFDDIITPQMNANYLVYAQNFRKGQFTIISLKNPKKRTSYQIKGSITSFQWVGNDLYIQTADSVFFYRVKL